MGNKTAFFRGQFFSVLHLKFEGDAKLFLGCHAIYFHDNDILQKLNAKSFICNLH